MPDAVLLGADIVAVCLLVFGLYFPRHRRRDLIAAYLAVNIGVLAVASALSSGTVGAGLGLGLFGVLSIIRLRSTELDQTEVAYYFSALALGLLGGLGGDQEYIPIGLMGLILVTLFVADHPRLLRGYTRQTLVLDAAITNPTVLRGRVEQILGGNRVHSVSVERIDLVNDTTIVEVRYELRVGAQLADRETVTRAGV